MKANLQQLEEMQKELFRQQCDLDIQKAMVKHFIKKKQAKQLTLTDVVASVLCTKSNYILGVTKDIEYTLIEESDEFYIIINDLGYKGGYLKEDFVKSTMK